MCRTFVVISLLVLTFGLVSAATVTGKVIDADGKPIKGANVLLYLFQPGKRIALELSTDAGGGYAAEVDPALLQQQNTVIGMIFAYAPGYTLAQARLKKSGNVITLNPGTSISGAVVDEAGKPLAGAPVCLAYCRDHDGNSVAVPVQWSARFTVHSAADGGWTLPGIPLDGNAAVALNDDRYVRELREITLVDGVKAASVSFKVHPGATVTGRVLTPEGAPVADARVDIYAANDTEMNSPATSDYGKTAADGSYRLTGLSTGTYTINVYDIKQVWVAAPLHDVKLAEGKETAVPDLRIRFGAALEGTVLDGEGKPVAGVSFCVSMNNASSWNAYTQVQFITDQQGKFKVSRPPADKVVITLFIDQQSCAWELPAPLDIEVPVKEPITITLRQRAMHGVTGRVVDTRHHPLAGVTVTFDESFESYKPSQKLTANTGADGGYQLAKIPAGFEVSLLTLEKPGYCQLTADRLLHTTNDTLGDAVMAACTGTVHGKVCDAAGKPVQGATVVSVEGGRSIRAVTDGAGAFTLPNQPDGALHLVAATPTGGGLATCPANTANMLITCTPGLVAKPNDIPLALAWLDADGKLPKEQRRLDRSDTIRKIADIDLKLAIRLAQTGSEPVSDGLRAYLLVRQAALEPAKVDLVQLNSFQDSDCKFYAAVETGIAEVKANPELAVRLYLIAKPLYDQAAHGNSWNHIEGLGNFEEISLHILALAALLHKTTDLDAMLAALSTSFRAYDINHRIWFTDWLAAAAGRVSPEFVFKVFGSLDEQSDSRYFSHAVTSMARYNPKEALHLLKMLEAKKYDVMNDYTVLEIIDALGKQSPALVLAMAKAQPEHIRASALLEAAAFQSKETARSLMRSIFSVAINQTIMNVAKAYTIDPEVGKALYTKFQQHLEAENCAYDDTLPQHYYNCAEYARWICDIDPLEARLIVETEYARAFSLNEPVDSVDPACFALPMSALDLHRAEAMLAAGNKPNTPYYQQQIMQSILMSREERVSLLVQLHRPAG